MAIEAHVDRYNKYTQLDILGGLTPGTSRILGYLFAIDLARVAPQFAEFCAQAELSFPETGRMRNAYVNTLVIKMRDLQRAQLIPPEIDYLSRALIIANLPFEMQNEAIEDYRNPKAEKTKTPSIPEIFQYT